MAATTTQTETTPRNDHRRPEAVFRIGSVSASVFTREIPKDGEPRLVRSISVRARYMDDNRQAKYTSSFGLAELPLALRTLQLAQEYVEAREAQVVGPDDMRQD